MKRAKKGFALVWILTGIVFVGTLYGQSLADFARAERARKSGEAKEAKVYTNEDIGAAQPSPAPAPATQPAQQAAAGAETAAAEAKEAPAEPAGAKKDMAAMEKEYREKAARLREELTYEERRLDVLQRELSLAQTQYYSDPNVAMREQHTRAEINTRTQEIQDQQAVVDKAKQAIEDLEEELRRNSLPPGWAR
ncbi:MAG: hypothetical protein HY649_08295 [Acidobacteria bacterium]|nr:hypothetical protein [Acidobacteriota bacterium]